MTENIRLIIYDCQITIKYKKILQKTNNHTLRNTTIKKYTNSTAMIVQTIESIFANHFVETGHLL